MSLVEQYVHVCEVKTYESVEKIETQKSSRSNISGNLHSASKSLYYHQAEWKKHKKNGLFGRILRKVTLYSRLNWLQI